MGARAGAGARNWNRPAASRWSAWKARAASPIPAWAPSRRCWPQADCILLLGKRLDFTLKFGKAPAIAADCLFLQVDAETAEFERTRRVADARLAECALADAASAMDALLQATAAGSDRHDAWTRERARRHRLSAARVADRRLRTGGAHASVQALAPVQKLLDSHPDSVFIADGGEIGQWAQACLHAPNRVINGVAGSIGAALPFALAARLARSRRARGHRDG